MDQSSVQFTDAVDGNDYNSYRYGADRISDQQRQYVYRNSRNVSRSKLSLASYTSGHRSSVGPNDFSFAASDSNAARDDKINSIPPLNRPVPKLGEFKLIKAVSCQPLAVSQEHTLGWL
jgi:hypothetical protein